MDENELKNVSPESNKSIHGDDAESISSFPGNPKVLYSIGHSGDDIKFVSSNLLNSEKNKETNQGLSCTLQYNSDTNPDITAMSVLSLYDKQHNQMDKFMDTER